MYSNEIRCFGVYLTNILESSLISQGGKEIMQVGNDLWVKTWQGISKNWDMGQDDFLWRVEMVKMLDFGLNLGFPTVNIIRALIPPFHDKTADSC